MKRLIHKAFGIYPGEGKTALRFIRLAIFWSLGSSIVEILSISLFIEKIGTNHLPIAYMITSLGLILISSFFMYLLRRTTPHNIFYNVLYITGCFILITTTAISTSLPNWYWFFLQISTSILVSALIASFWTFVSQYHDLQDAKRIYGIYNASYFLGCVISGGLINAMFDKIGYVGLFAASALSIALAIVETYFIKKKVASIEDDVSEGFFAGGKRGFLSIIRIFYKSPFAIILVTMSIIIQLMRTTTEYSYMEAFEKLFDPVDSKEKICQFLAKCKGYIAIFNIIMGMFFYGRFVKKVGLGNMLLIPPIFFVTLYTEWSIANSLFIAIMAIICVEGILYTIEDNNFNLLVNATPYKLQNLLRIINDSFFEPAGMLLCSVFLVFLQSYNFVLGLILAFVFLTTSLIIKYLYPRSILKNLKENAIHFERKFVDWLCHLNKKEQKEIQEDVLEALNSNHEEIKILAFETLMASNDINLLASLLPHIEKFSVQGKIRILKILNELPHSSNPKIIEMIDNLLEASSSEALCKYCNLYLAKRGLLHPEKVVHFLDSKDLFLRATAIITLKLSKAKLPPETVALNKAISTKEMDLLLKSHIEEEICIGLDILSEERSQDSLQKALKFLSFEQTNVKISAAEALAKLADKSASSFAFQIIEEMTLSSCNKFRLFCLKALGKIQDSSTVKEIILASIFFRPSERRLVETIIIDMGLKTVPGLISIIKDTKLHDRCRILAGKILGRIALPQLQANLSDIIEIEIKRAYFYFFFAHKIQKQYPLYDLRLLENSLLTGYQSALDFIIHLLSAARSMDDCELIIHSLRSKNAKARAQAIETLEKKCNQKIFKKIKPLIDDVPWETKIEGYFQIHGTDPNLNLLELLNVLENSASLFDRTVAAHLKAKFKMPDWRESLREQIKTSDGPFHQYAYELLES